MIRISSRDNYPKIEQIKPNIYHVSYDNKDDMHNACVRIFATYETEEFKDKIFTEKEFREWFNKIYGSDFNDSWSGFNFSSKVIKPFIGGDFDPLNPDEKELIDLFRNINGEYSIIATYSTYKYIHETLPHEIAHALWEFNSEYKDEIRKILNQYNTQSLKDFIKKQWKYKNELLEDELQAFLLTNKDMLEENGFDTSPYHELMNKIKQVYERYK